MLRHGAAAAPIGRPGAERPFHGIISRGMLGCPPADGAAAWERWSPLLDGALEGDERALATVPAEVVGAARACGVLTFAQSAEAARRFATELVGAADDVELWNVREGHTSSVWRLTAHDAAVRLAINVARDEAAGEELERSAHALDELAAAATPEASVARVVAAGRVDIGSPVAVMAQEWVQGGAELALLRRRGGGLALHAVTEWVTSEDEPGRLTGAVGHTLDEGEHVDAARRAARLLLAAARPVGAGALRFPRIDLRHGDWMWAAEGLHVVASAGAGDVVERERTREFLRGMWADEPLLARGADQAWREALGE